MPEGGVYLLSNVGFNRDEKPFITLQQGSELHALLPLEKELTISVDTSKRFCTGWRDITKGERFVCPTSTPLDAKYEQCPACQRRTGFNPAFYHASSVSSQQEEWNQQPHILYLAYFSQNVIKVGITLAARGNSRLLEQGARSALILDTFPTAHIARQYEAKIAALPGFAETVLLSKKIEALRAPFDTKKADEILQASRQAIEKSLATTFPQHPVLHLDSFFFPEGVPLLNEAFDCQSMAKIAGRVQGMFGSLLFCDQQDTSLFLPLKKFVGYHLTLSHASEEMELPARQVSLFDL